MKPFSLYTFAILFILCSLSACTSDKTISQKSVDKQTKDKIFVADIPAINPREGKLAEAPEWEEIQAEAQSLYQKVRLTGDAKSALYLAAIYMQEARITGDHPYYYNAALKVLDVVIANPPKEPILKYQAMVSKASVLLSQHQFVEALEVGEKALLIEQKDAQVYGVLCDANVELGNYEKAVEMADKMISIKPDLRSYARISYLRELHGDFDGAVEAMNLAIKAGVPSHENTAWARHTLANLYLEYGKVEKAKMQLKKCLAERPTYAFALATLAEIELEEGQIEKAKTTIEKACELMPEFSFFVTKSKIQKIQGKTEAFDQTRNDLLVMMQEDTESGHNMSLETAKIYLDLFEDTNKALNAVLPEFELRGNNIEINKLLGEIYFASKDFKKASQHFDKASITNWSDPNLYCLKGLALCEMGETQKGKQILRKVINTGTLRNQDLLDQSKKYI